MEVCKLGENLLRTAGDQVVYVETSDGKRYKITRVEDTTIWPLHEGVIDLSGKIYAREGEEFQEMLLKMRDADDYPVKFNMVLVDGASELYLFRMCVRTSAQVYGGRGTRVIEFIAMRGVDHDEAIDFLIKRGKDIGPLDVCTRRFS